VALIVSLAIITQARGADRPAATAGEYGPTPTIPPPEKKALPTLKMAKAVGWEGTAAPKAGKGLHVSLFAQGLQHPRWLYVLPNGDVLVAESEASPKPEDAKGVRGEVQKLAQKRAGSGASPSANRITLLRDLHNDGRNVERHTFLENLNSPIGMALIGDEFYVADSDAVVKVPYKAGDTNITATPVKVTDLPAGPINHHWTKSLLASSDGQKLYVGVGSNSNAGENGIEAEQDRNAVWEIDAKSGEHRLYANGLRNPVGLAWEPDSHVLWVAVNERDELGDHVPPDYMTGLKRGAFYGFPYSYYGHHLDERMKPQDAALVAKAIAPDYALGVHTASLGLCWSGSSALPALYRHGMFIGQHGSWNRSMRSGYKVIFVSFADGAPRGMPIDVLTGFLNSKGEAQGRPVGVAIGKDGSLLVADDVGNRIWRVTGQ
jgi:glucose/arabinose dehydrogenase